MSDGKEDGREQVPGELPANPGHARRVVSEGEEDKGEQYQDADGTGVLPGEGLPMLDTRQTVTVVVCPHRKRIDGVADEDIRREYEVDIKRPMAIKSFDPGGRVNGLVVVSPFH